MFCVLIQTSVLIDAFLEFPNLMTDKSISVVLIKSPDFRGSRSWSSELVVLSTNSRIPDISADASAGSVMFLSLSNYKREELKLIK